MYRSELVRLLELISTDHPFLNRRCSKNFALQLI
jgi:hypothetical protein